jgi:hypothetical protein
MISNFAGKLNSAPVKSADEIFGKVFSRLAKPRVQRQILGSKKLKKKEP